MKAIKGLIYCLIIIVFSMFFVNYTFAASTIISADNMKADFGKTISFPIRISGNVNGVSTFGIKIKYDSTVMIPKNEITNGIYTGDIIFNPTYKGTEGVAFATGASSSNKKGDGALFYIDFEIKESVVKEKAYSINLEVDELKYIENAKTVDITYTITNGSITINESGSSSGGEEPDNQNKIVISTENVKLNAGKVVSVPIIISGNANGISTFGIKVNYDSTVMTPKSDVTNGIYTSDIIFNPTYKGTEGVAFATGASSTNKKGDGIL
ncbi:hypothetical protein IJ596_06725, partial [bacterium]|nr:hypothetical protein [bacterium]